MAGLHILFLLPLLRGAVASSIWASPRLVHQNLSFEPANRAFENHSLLPNSTTLNRRRLLWKAPSMKMSLMGRKPKIMNKKKGMCHKGKNMKKKRTDKGIAKRGGNNRDKYCRWTCRESKLSPYPCCVLKCRPPKPCPVPTLPPTTLSEVPASSSPTALSTSTQIPTTLSATPTIYPSTSTPVSPIIAYADHISTVIPVEDIRSISKGLLRLGLGYGWPPRTESGYITVGVRFGNLNLELANWTESSVPVTQWLSFEPMDIRTLNESLVERGFEPIFNPVSILINGTSTLVYERVFLPSLSDSSTVLQINHNYIPTNLSGPVAPPNAAGIIKVLYVDIGVDESRLEAFTNMIAPLEIIDNEVHFESGPIVRVNLNTPTLDVYGFTLEVENIAAAQEALVAAGLERIGDDKVQVGTLNVSLVEIGTEATP